MPSLARFLPENPVLTKELRVRMRGARAYWIMLGYLGFIAVLELVRYNSFTQSVSAAGAGGSNAAAVGGEVYTWLMVPQIFLVLFITPAITSGALTIEREQQTMEMLTLTRLSRRSIVTGKLLSAVSFTALLIVSSLPLISICFMLGGIDPGLVFSAYVEMLTATVLIGAMGIMWSSVAKSTTIAVIMTYITLALIFAFGWMVFDYRVSPFNASAAAAIYQLVGANWFGDSFLGLHVPEGAGFSIICLLAGVLMTAVATVRIEMFPDRKAYILRGLTLLVFAIQFLALDMMWTGSWYHRNASATAVQPPIGVLMLSGVALLLVTPIFATGTLASFEARRFVKHILWGFTPAGFKRGKLASGIPFLMLLTCVVLGMYALSFVFAGHRADVGASGALSLGLPGVPPPAAPQLKGKEGETVTVSGVTVTVSEQNGSVISASKLPDGTVQVTTFGAGGQSSVVIQKTWPSTVPQLPPPPPPVKIVVPQTGDFAQGALMLVVCVGGFGLFCFLLSVAFRSRWLAVTLAYILLLIIFAVPEIAASSARAGISNPFVVMSVNGYYLNPVQAFLQMCEPASFWESRTLWFGQTPMWLMVTKAWAAIGGLSCLLMIPFVLRLAREDEPIPYEEQVMMA